MKVVRTSFRIFVGIVFIFSGFVKGVDPLGTVYRIQDYFLAFGTTWANDAALPLTIFLCALEFCLGVSLLFNLAVRYTSWILLPMMSFFTILTYFDAFYNMVPDCGCFGDAVKLTNMETFIKNLVLMLFVIPLFLWKNHFTNKRSLLSDVVMLSLVAVLFMGMSVYALQHLPPLDFRDWKVGNQVNQTGEEPVRFYVTYKNRKTGENQEFLSPDYPWNDTVWLANWEFISQRVEDPNQDAMSLLIEDETGNDLAQSFLNIPDYHFFVVSYSLEETHVPSFTKLESLYEQVSGEGLSFIALTGSLPVAVSKFKTDHHLDFDFYSSDDIVLKSMIRSNPGLILLKNGRVVKKWHYNDIPDWDEIRDIMAHTTE